VHRRDFAEDVRGRKNLFRIEDQVVFFYGDAVNSVGIDKARQVDAQQIQQAFNWQMRGLDVIGVETNMTSRIRRDSSNGFK